MSNHQSIGQVTTSKPLAKCNMEELAAYQRSIQPRGGVQFARSDDGEQKTLARERILELFSLTAWPKYLHMLTMPGVNWRFERKLLGLREVGWMRRPAPRYTTFTSSENNRVIYNAAVTQMPGLHTPFSALKPIRDFPFAELGVKTKYGAFFFANIDDLLAYDGWDKGWDAAWLDYTGYLTVARLKIIEQFYHRFVRSILIVTAFNGHWPQDTYAAIERAGGHSAWLHAHLPGLILHDIKYQDTAPMIQYAVKKHGWQSPLV